MTTLATPLDLLNADARRFLTRLSKPAQRPWLHDHDADGTIKVEDPGTGEVLVELPATSAAGVDAAVRAARAALNDGRWSETDADHRERTLLRLADLVERDAAALTHLEGLDTGKPLAQATGDIREASMVIRYFAGWCTKVSGTTIAAPRRYAASTLVEPVGVCAAITPWNYPLPILLYKLAPALAFGNSFVGKPSELAPLSAIYFAELCAEAGVPDGVVNLVIGGPTTGAALSSHPDLDKMAFTGSGRTGQAVMTAAAANLTKVTLELGGKSPQIVFASADLDAAVAGVMDGIWTNAGQVCVGGSRLLVEASVADEFTAKLADGAQRLQVGHSLDAASEMGPMISRVQRDRAAAIVARAVASGGRAAAGGHPVDGPGYFLEPTVLTGLTRDAEATITEIFAPVLVVDTFTTEDDAVDAANATEYGLAAGVWTGNGAQAHRVARRLTSGTVWINTYGVFHPTLPFGGTKRSGFGRELGAAAVEQYTERKTVVEDISLPGA